MSISQATRAFYCGNERKKNKRQREKEKDNSIKVQAAALVATNSQTQIIILQTTRASCVCFFLHRLFTWAALFSLCARAHSKPAGAWHWCSQTAIVSATNEIVLAWVANEQQQQRRRRPLYNDIVSRLVINFFLPWPTQSNLAPVGCFVCVVVHDQRDAVCVCVCVSVSLSLSFSRFLLVNNNEFVFGKSNNIFHCLDL